MEERDYEAEAKEQGWNPDYEGPNKTDAKTFVERGEQIAGILKSKNAKLEERIQRLEQSNQEFGEYHKQTLQKQREMDARKIRELEEQLAQAITDGDGQAYTQYQKEIDTLKSNQQNVQTDEAAWNRLSQQWVSENPWYMENRKMARFADGIADEVRARVGTGPAYFSELTREVMEEFKDEFKNPKKSTPNAVEDGGQKGTGDSKAKTFDNLPADAKAAFKQFNRDFGLSKEDYLATYEWDE